MLITLVLVAAKKSRTSSSPISSEREGVQELGGSTARQIAQVGQGKYSMPWMSCLVCKGELTSEFQVL